MPKPAPQPAPNPRSTAAGEFGLLAEALVAQWLTQQGGAILQRRWRCRWGELDLIAQLPQTATTAATLAFVEVKARQNAGWDAGGLLAITPQKQAKLWQAAELFLSDHSDLAEENCRFDVALVWGRSRSGPAAHPAISPTSGILDIPNAPIALGRPMAIAHYTLTLQHYLPNAFSAI